MKLITLICICGGSQDIPVESLQLHPGGFITCNYMRTENGEHITCTLKYPVSVIYKAVEAGRNEYDARIEKRQLPMGIKG